MGTHGLCARVRVGTLAGGRRGRRVIAPFVFSSLLSFTGALGLGYFPPFLSFLSLPPLPPLASDPLVFFAFFSSFFSLSPLVGSGRLPTGAAYRSFRCFDRTVAGAGGVFFVLLASSSPPNSSGPRPHLCLPLQVPLPLEGRTWPATFGSLLVRRPHRSGSDAARTDGSDAARTDGSDAAPTECLRVRFSACLCRSHFRSRRRDVGPAAFGPSHGRHGAQRPPCQSFQIQFDAVGAAVKYAAPAEHLHRLGAALRATARSGCPAGASASKFRAVMIVSAQNWVSS